MKIHGSALKFRGPGYHDKVCDLTAGSDIEKLYLTKFIELVR